MFDAIANFVVYLKDCIEKSNDPEEIARLESVLQKAERISDRIQERATAAVASAE